MSRLVLPYDVEQVFVDTIDRRHLEHLAKCERERDVQPRTFQPYATVVRMSDASAVRLSGDTVPACLLGVIGVPSMSRNEDNGFDVTYQVGMQVTVMGNKRRDTLLRRDVMAWTTVECLMQRTPRGGDALLHSIRLTDYEPLAESDTQRTLGDARLVFEVMVRDVMDLGGYLPAEGRGLPVPPQEPYDVPGPPVTATSVTVEIDRLPIVE